MKNLRQLIRCYTGLLIRFPSYRSTDFTGLQTERLEFCGLEYEPTMHQQNNDCYCVQMYFEKELTSYRLHFSKSTLQKNHGKMEHYLLQDQQVYKHKQIKSTHIQPNSKDAVRQGVYIFIQP